MNIRRNLIWFCGTPLIVAGLLLVVLLDPDHFEHLILGYLFGTVFGQATLASAWTAFGPLPFLWRFPLALLWLLAIMVALACNMGFHGGPSEITAIVAACLAGQFAFLQLPFWGLAVAGGLRLRYSASAAARPDPREMQFGIRQLMIFTAIVAVVLGASRFAVIHFAQYSNLGDEGPIFIFLAVAAVFVTLPLFLAALLPRFAIPAVALVLLLAGLLTAWDVPLLKSVHGGPGPDTLHVVIINGFTSAWVLAIVLIVRISGYRFGTSRIEAASA